MWICSGDLPFLFCISLGLTRGLTAALEVGDGRCELWGDGLVDSGKASIGFTSLPTTDDIATDGRLFWAVEASSEGGPSGEGGAGGGLVSS